MSNATFHDCIVLGRLALGLLALCGLAYLVGGAR